jgi:HSP20 family protein
MATEARNKAAQQRTGDVPIDRAPEEQGDAKRHEWPHQRSSYSPFAVMRQGIDEMDRWWSRVSGSGGWLSQSLTRGGFSQIAQQIGDWSPAVEAFQRGNEFVIRAEVPGMNRQDLTVEAGDDALTIRGERRQERNEDREGVYWTERSYGSFSRTIPLPPGAITDSAKATFNNGVLEIVMEAPSAETRRGRRIDIAGHPADTKK